MKTLKKLRDTPHKMKGQAQQAMNFILVVSLGLGLAAIVASVIATVLASVQTTQTANTLESNITGFGLTGINNIATQFGLIGTVAGLVAVLVVLFVFFQRKGKGGGFV